MFRPAGRPFAVFVLITLSFAKVAAGQTAAAPSFIDAPAAPVPPATINRDARQRATLRAVRIHARRIRNGA